MKICGLTNLEDTLAAAEHGALAAGFNFYPGSPRYIAPEVLAQWIHRVPRATWKVGVFVNERPERVREIAAGLELDIVQLHGDESPADVPGGLRTWKAARVFAAFDLSRLLSHLDGFQTEALLLDGPASGVPFDWALARSPTRKIILAGGLDADNVQAAIERVQPWGVDVCSRIESSPGKKDVTKMKHFIKTVLSC